MTDSVFNAGEPQPKKPKCNKNSSTPSQCGRSQATIYRPLDKAKREIRICDLSPAPELSDPLQCSLRTVSIDEAGKFVAFSYVWGTDAASETISVDGISFPIRPNLAAGLRRFRARFPERSQSRTGRLSRPISIWADAICINQDSVEERSHQVHLMRLIFTRCEYAFSWLGEADEVSDLAMDCIVKIASLRSKAEEGNNFTFIRNLTQENPFYEAGPWVAIHRLFRRDFWSRVWIFQELLLPKDLNVGCGSKCLPWSIFKELENLIYILNRDGFLIREATTHIDSDIQDKIIAVSRILKIALEYVVLLRENKTAWFQSCTMEQILVINQHLQATDSRDKIYGFLALAENYSVQPDYSKTTQQVYTEAAISILPHNPNFLIFSGISTVENATSSSIASSWVPDWDWITRSAVRIAAPWRDIELYSRCWRDFRLGSKFEFKHLLDMEILYARGQLCHTVVNSKLYTEWLDPKCFDVTIRSMYGRSYPQWTEYGRLEEPIQKIVALCRTVIQRVEALMELEEYFDLAAGFCYSTSLKIDSRNDTETAIAAISLPTLLQLFVEEFGQQPEAFSHPERCYDGYLAEEKASLHKRVFFETPAGHFGLGPPEAKDGDIICKIYGCRWPLIFRKVDSHYILVGACWVLGFIGDQGVDESHSEMIEIW
jgi:hypothetical protein